jgi:hypothetical protein
VASALTSLITQVRVHLVEPSPAYWTDAELLGHLTNGAKDLWRKIVGQYQEHFVTIDDTHVTLGINGASLSGVPLDVYRVVAVEPRVVGDGNPNQGLIFKNRKYNSPDFIQARAASPVTPQGTIIFYDVMNAGAPVGAPTILVAPTVTALVNLRLVYNQVLPPMALSGAPPTITTNPIPGESDNALIAWTVAYARAKENADRTPDPTWLAVYGTEKQNLIAELSIPRSEQDQEVVEGMFQDLWPDWQ